MVLLGWLPTGEGKPAWKQKEGRAEKGWGSAGMGGQGDNPAVMADARSYPQPSLFTLVPVKSLVQVTHCWMRSFQREERGIKCSTTSPAEYSMHLSSMSALAEGREEKERIGLYGYNPMHSYLEVSPT